MKITYLTKIIPDIAELLDLYTSTGYFPIEDRSDTERLKKMMLHANIVLTAWDGDRLVGLARALSDFCYCCYLSEVCVHGSYQGRGIGQELVLLTRKTAGDGCKLILHASPESVAFYSKIGMKHIDTAFMLPRKQ